MLTHGASKVLAVADCGSRVVPLLSKKPSSLTCVDINREQLALCELRIALLRTTTLQEYKQFLGYTPGMTATKRQLIFRSLTLHPDTSSIAGSMMQASEWSAFLYRGKFERMLRTLHKVNSACTGKRGRELFDQETLQDQQAFYLDRFPLRRWKALLAILGNATTLNMLLYRGCFPRNNTGESHRKTYGRIFESLMYRRPARKSFFLQVLFFGKIVYDEGLPMECDPAAFSAAKHAANACDITFRHGDVFESNGGKTFDFVSLSDVPSFLPRKREPTFLAALRPVLDPDARIVVRSHLRRPAPELVGFEDVTHEYPSASENESTQLWRFHAYQCLDDSRGRVQGKTPSTGTSSNMTALGN